MRILDNLKERWDGIDDPFLIHHSGELNFKNIAKQKTVDLSDVNKGDVVALIGNYDPQSILTLLKLIERDVIVVPLTVETRSQHEYFFKSAFVDVIIEGNSIKILKNKSKHKIIEQLRLSGHAGLVLFSTGTTGRPKAILHDLTLFMERYQTPRPSLKTLNFLLFDHIGGLNTLLHTLFNKGSVVVPKSRSIEDILQSCKKHKIELLPTTPTFLRMMLISGLIPGSISESLKVITYGTERMDEPTLKSLCRLLPNIDFRQTFGMSELGIVRVKSKSRDSLFMKIGGEGIETRVVNSSLEIRSQSRMLGYLNASSPFDKNNWYKTNDIVEEKEGYYKIIGRTNEVINVGGLKFMASEVERVALEFDGVELVKAEGKFNPITGQHVELSIQAKEKYLNIVEIKTFLKNKLPKHMMPSRIKISKINIGHRYKKI